MLVVGGHQVGAVFDGSQIDQAAALDAFPIALWLSVHTQARKTAVRIKIHAQVCEGARVVDCHVMVLVALQRHGRHDYVPLSVVRRSLAVCVAGLERSSRRKIAGEMARVQIYAMNHAWPRQLNHAVVVPRGALAARFPAVHPFAVIVVLAGNEYRRLRIEHALFRREEFIAGEERLRTEARVGQIHVAARKGGGVGVEDRSSHGLGQSQSMGRGKPAGAALLVGSTPAGRNVRAVGAVPWIRLHVPDRQTRARPPFLRRPGHRDRRARGSTHGGRGPCQCRFPRRPLRPWRRNCQSDW